MATRAAKNAENGVEQEENGAVSVEQGGFRTISIADSDEMVLKLNKIEGLELRWEATGFRKLPSKVQEELKLDNLKRYVVAEAEADLNANKAVRRMNPFNPILGNAEAREYIRPRKGWHQAWKNPGRDYEAAVQGPYQAVRKPTKEQEKEGYEPGEEAGEIMVRKDSDGKDEAIAVECREKDFQDYLEWMSEESSAKYTGIQNGFVQQIEDVNRSVTRKGARIIPMVDGVEVH